MEVITTYTLKINRVECTALVKLLGRLSDTEMAQKGLSSEEIAIIHEAWNILPIYDDDDE